MAKDLGRRHDCSRRVNKWPPLTVDQILAWADAYRAAHGYWPTKSCTPRRAESGDTWLAINSALRSGWRGLPGGMTLVRLLAERRGRAIQRRPRELSVDQILAWADRYHEAHGYWPGRTTTPRTAESGETWCAIDQALRTGWHGLPGGSSLRRLLAEHRGRRGVSRHPELSVERILAWADSHHAATGHWPTRGSGPVAEAPFETWRKVEQALRLDIRGLAGQTTLARLLAWHRGVRNQRARPRLTIEQIVAWADAHHAATGRWPTRFSGPVAAAPGETWPAIRQALRAGFRGLPGGMTISDALANRKLPRQATLTVELIRAWAEGHQKATGVWPHAGTGPVAGVPGESWRNIDRALRRGSRGLAGGMNLTTVLGLPNDPDRPRDARELTVDQVLAWADAHHAVTGRWPNENSGRVLGAPHETWREINRYLKNGGAGLPRGMSLTGLIDRDRNPAPPRRQ